MAKKQGFGDKVNKKKGTGGHHIKLIRTGRGSKSGALRFYEEIVRIPDEKSANVVVKELLAKEA